MRVRDSNTRPVHPAAGAPDGARRAVADAPLLQEQEAVTGRTYAEDGPFPRNWTRAPEFRWKGELACFMPSLHIAGRRLLGGALTAILEASKEATLLADHWRQLAGQWSQQTGEWSLPQARRPSCRADRLGASRHGSTAWSGIGRCHGMRQGGTQAVGTRAQAPSASAQETPPARVGHTGGLAWIDSRAVCPRRHACGRIGPPCDAPTELHRRRFPPRQASRTRSQASSAERGNALAGVPTAPRSVNPTAGGQT
jgi:hypothetical protein